MSFVNRIVVLSRTCCQGCGLYVCKPGDYLCKTCEAEFVAAIDAQAASVDLDVEVAAMWQEEQLRKSEAP